MNNQKSIARFHQNQMSKMMSLIKPNKIKEMTLEEVEKYHEDKFKKQHEM